MNSYPYTITNGSGESLTFLGVVRTADGDRVEAESWRSRAQVRRCTCTVFRKKR